MRRGLPGMSRRAAASIVRVATSNLLALLRWGGDRRERPGVLGGLMGGRAAGRFRGGPGRGEGVARRAGGAIEGPWRIARHRAHGTPEKASCQCYRVGRGRMDQLVTWREHVPAD